VRNKIEDGKILPVFKVTEQMVADIGTKPLDAYRFGLLRDQLTGYA
jgi:hypothetical protein